MVNRDRTIAPKLGIIKKLGFPEITTSTLDNGIRVKQIMGCSQPVCNINVVIKGGSYISKEPFIAACTANLLSEGTLKHPGNKLSELLDFYGFTVSANASMYNTRISIRTLTKHIETAVAILAQMILTPEFSEENFKIDIEQSSEGLKIANEKVNYLAQKELLQLLYGRKHHFSRLNSIASLKKIKLSDIVHFHKENYCAANMTIYVSGDVPKETIDLLNKQLGNQENISTKQTIYAPIEPISQHYSFIKKKGANQSAIFMGKTLVPYSHEDFPAIYFLNVVMGGYFGSRLMTKLREEMGVTYGVNSYILPRKENTELFISTEVKTEATQESKLAIEQVIAQLQEETMTSEEINNVRNYIIGSIANLFDSSFSVTNQLITIEYANSNLESFNRIIETAQTITPEKIREIAQKYLNSNEFVCAIAGN